MCEEHSYSLVYNSLKKFRPEDHNHELRLPRTVPKYMTPNFSQSFDVDQNQNLITPSINIDDLQYHQVQNLLIQEDLVSFNNTAHVQYSLGFPEAAIIYDPLTSSLCPNLNLPPQPTPLLMEFGRSSAVASASRNSGHGGKYCLFGSDIGDEWEGLIGGRVYDDQEYGEYGLLEQFENNNGILLDFTMENLCHFGGANRGSNNRSNPFATERQRRVQMSDKYNSLRDLIPNPTKPDRASTVGDAIEYIKELTRTIHELKIHVEKKRYERNDQDHVGKSHKIDHQDHDSTTTTMIEFSYDKKPTAVLDNESDNHDQSCSNYNNNKNNMFLRSSSLQRKSNNAEMDVRIIDNEVTIKLSFNGRGSISFCLPPRCSTNLGLIFTIFPVAASVTPTVFCSTPRYAKALRYTPVLLPTNLLRS